LLHEDRGWFLDDRKSFLVKKENDIPAIEEDGFWVKTEEGCWMKEDEGYWLKKTVSRLLLDG